MKIVLLLLALSLPLAAQRKLWTWESPLKNQDYIGSINASMVDAKGYTALVIGEAWFDGGQTPVVSRHRILWIAPTGKVLHEEVIDRSGESSREAVDGLDFWKILYVSNVALAVTDGKELWTVKLKKKAKAREVTAVSEFTELITPAGTGANFPGWIQQTSAGQGWFDFAGGNYHFAAPKSVSLWSLK